MRIAFGLFCWIFVVDCGLRDFGRVLLLLVTLLVGCFLFLSLFVCVYFIVFTFDCGGWVLSLLFVICLFICVWL